MKLKNTPTIEYLSESVFKNFVRFEEDKVVLKDSCPKELAIIFYYMEPSDIRVVYEMSNPVCECGNRLDKHAIIKWEMDLTYSIFKYQYKCRTCGKTIITPLNDIVDKYSSYTKDTKDLVVNIYSNEHISYANATKFINEDQGLNISKQSIYNYNVDKTDDYLLEKEKIIEEKLEEKDIDLSGFPGHDEAFCRINGEKYSFLAMVDSNNQRIINDQLIPEEEYRDLLETFITYSLKDLSIYKNPEKPNPPHPLLLPDLKKDTLIGDGLKEYPNIAKKNNMDFHPCGFHKIMNQRKPIWKIQKRLFKKIESNKKKIEKNNEKINRYYEKYKGQFKKIGNKDKKRRREKDKVTKMEKENKELKAENKKLKKEYDEYENYNERISEIFKQDTIKKAKMRFNILNNQIDKLPDEIAKFIRKLRKNLDQTLSHIENKNIPNTNNWLELFFNIIFPKKYRNRFKTIPGVTRFLRARKIKWHENIVLKEEIKIQKDTVWTHMKTNSILYYQELKTEEKIIV